MAKGAQAKSEVMSKILATFDGAFLYDKDIRVPVMENGELVQIKIALTCAKVNVECGNDTALPGETDFPTPIYQAPTVANTQPVAPSEEEKRNVETLLRRLGL